MMQFLKFWLDCFEIGWSTGGLIISFIKLLAGIVFGILLYKNLTQHKKIWEDRVLKFSVFIFAAVLIVTTIFVAPFLKFSGADEALKKAEANGPRLDGFVNQEIEGEDTQTNSLVILQVSVNNSGNLPSIAENYRLKIFLTNDTALDGELIDVPDEYTTVAWKSNSPIALTLKRAELISEKTSRAIAPGEGPRGWIAYKFHNVLLSQYLVTNYTMVLSFMDVGGNKIFVTNGWWKGKKAGEMETYDYPHTFPGSDNLMSRPVSQFLITNTTVLPPELPPDCTNVTLFFGGQGYSISKVMAEISREGTQFKVADLPDFLLSDLDKSPNYSPLRKTMWYKLGTLTQDFGGTQVAMPMVPYVVSNRLFVEFNVPYLNEMRRLIMSDGFDDALSNMPPRWDRNYATNCWAYEIVNEYTNPVFQVFYTAPNEVHINGIFIVSTNSFLESFGEPPRLFSFAYRLLDTNEVREFTNTTDLSGMGGVRLVGTNSIGRLLTNCIYDAKFPNQQTIFKYPSNRHPGEFAN